MSFRRTRKNPLATAKDVEPAIIERADVLVPPAVAAEVDEQVGPAVTTDLAGREFSWNDDGSGGGYPAVGGTPIGPTRPWPSGTWSGTAGKPEIPLDVSVEGGLDKTATTFIDAGLSALIATHAGSRKLRFPKGDYKIGDTAVLIKSNTHMEIDPGVRFICDAVPPSINYFQTDGYSETTPVAMTADNAAGSASITLPTGAGAGFASGDMIGLQSQAVLFRNTDDTADVRPREIRQVISISGDVATLDAPLEHTYLVADTAEYFKATMVENVTIEGTMRFFAGPNVTPGTDSTRAIHMVKGRNVSIGDIQFHNMVGGLLAYDCYDMYVQRVLVDRLPRLSAFPGYGIALGGACTNTVVGVIQARECRHPFTTLGTTIGGIFYDGPQFIHVDTAVIFGAKDAVTAALDTHPEGRHISFGSVTIVGGLHGMQIRNKYTYVESIKCINQKGSGLKITPQAEHVWVDSAIIRGSGAQGILNEGKDVHLTRPSVSGCGWDVSSGGITTSGSIDTTIIDPELYDNIPRGISDSTTNPSTNLRIIGGRIPYSATQPVSVYALPTDAKMTGTMCDGFGAGATGLLSPQTGSVWSIQTDSRVVGSNEITGSAALNFGSIAAQSSASLTLTATGATPGDPVALGIPLAAVTAGIAFTARVSATNTVTVTAHNYTAGALDPASGTFRVRVMPL